MKLVSIHKLWLVFLFMMIIAPIQAQVWSLERCIDTARVHNIRLKISNNNIALSEQKHKEAKATMLPKIMGNMEYKYFADLPYQMLPLSALNPAAPEGEFREAQFGVPHNISANLQLVVPLYNPKAYGAIQATEIGTELSVLTKQKTEDQITFEISNLYYNAQILYHQLTFIEENIITTKRLLENIQLLRKHSLATITDVNKVELQVAQLTTQKQKVEGKYQQVLTGLKFIMGTGLDYNLQIDTNITYSQPAKYQGSTTLELETIKAQNRLLTIEERTIKNSRLLPTISLFATYGTTGFGYDKGANSFLNFYPVSAAGIQLSYPLFDGSITKHKINQKRMELENNDLLYEFQSEQTVMDIENIAQERTLAISLIENSSEQVKLAQSIYEKIIVQQKEGVASLSEVLKADTELREAQQDYINALVEYLKSELELKRLTNQLRNDN